jgi:hypothetical protein
MIAVRKPRPAGNKKSLLCASQGLLANCIGNCWLQQLAAQLNIPAQIFYCGIAHKFEYLSNQ